MISSLSVDAIAKYKLIKLLLKENNELSENNMQEMRDLVNYKISGNLSLRQEPMTRSLQLYCVRVTAFSQTDLFLD